MKKIILTFTIAGLLLTACNGSNKPKAGEDEKSQSVALSRDEIRSRSFNELFNEITPEELQGNVFTLVGSDYTVITAGAPTEYNSMVASFGGWGILFEKPVTWCFLRSNRYTLEMIRKEKKYTMTYFDKEYQPDIMLFGTKSGRDTEKMKESKLTSVQTPLGNTTYKEAKLIIECELTEVTTISPDDFYTDGGREFVTGAHNETGDYHKLVFGTITNVWVKK